MRPLQQIHDLYDSGIMVSNKTPMLAIESREDDIANDGAVRAEALNPLWNSIVANCIILNENGDILLLQRNEPHKRQLEVPGGGLRTNELPRRAAVRETLEEVGGITHIEITDSDRIITTRYKRRGRIRRHINFLATVTYDGDKLSALQPRIHDSVGFYSWEQLGEMEKTDLAANVRQLLKARREGRLHLDKRHVARGIN